MALTEQQAKNFNVGVKNILNGASPPFSECPMFFVPPVQAQSMFQRFCSAAFAALNITDEQTIAATEGIVIDALMADLNAQQAEAINMQVATLQAQAAAIAPSPPE